MRLNKRVFGFLAGALLLPNAGFTVFEAPPSDAAGVIDRQIEQEYKDKQEISPDRDVPMLEVEIPEEQLDMGDGETAFIQRITVEGNQSLSDKKVRSIVAPYEGKELSMRDIKTLCLSLQQAYAAEGFILARVYPPPQEITSGSLTLEALEGRLGNITIEGNKHYKETFIRNYFTKFQGKPINYNSLLRALFLLSENDDLGAGIVFKKGAEQGTADLIVRVTDKRPIHLYIDENNYGAHNTTIWRTGAKLDVGNLFMNGDKLSLTEVVGNPVSVINFTNASYAIPLNKNGTEMRLNYLYSNFHVEQLTSLHLRGLTQIATIEFSQALARTRTISTDVYTSFDYKQISNYQNNTRNSYDRLRVLTLGFSFDCTDHVRGRNIGDVYYTLGIPSFLGGLKPVDSTASRLGSGGSFSILNIDYTRIQSLPKDCFLMLHASGQTTPYKLPISEQFYIGGVDTVRGYPSATALGDMGYYANAELRAALPYLANKKVPGSHKMWKDVLQLVGFVDNGGILLNGGGENQQHHIMLTSAGVGLRIFGPWKFNTTFDVGFPLTEEKKQSSPVYYFKVAVNPF